MDDLLVFWPQNTVNNGTVIGWLHGKLAVVAAVVESEVRASVDLCYIIETVRKDLVDVEGHLRGHEKWLELQEDCQTMPIVLGFTRRANGGALFIRFQDESLNHVK